MGGFLLSTLKLFNLVWLNQFFKHRYRSGDSFYYRKRWGINFLYNLGEKSCFSEPGIIVTPKLLLLVEGSIHPDFDLCSKQDDSIFRCTEKFVIEKYQKHGINFSKYLNGDFSLVLLDFDRRVLIVSSDYLGTKPLFFSNETVKGAESWSISTYPSALHCLKLSQIFSVGPNRFMVWNVTVLERQILSMKFWKAESVHVLRVNSRKMDFSDWKHALINAIHIRYWCSFFGDEPQQVVLGLGRSEGNIVMEAALGSVTKISTSQNSSSSLSGATPKNFCNNVTYQQEPWNSTLFGDYGFWEKARQECLSFEGNENTVFLSDLGATEFFFGSHRLNSSSVVISQQIEHRAVALEIVLGSFPVDIRFPFLDKNVIQEWLWLHPTLQAAATPELLFPQSLNKFSAISQSLDSPVNKITWKQEESFREKQQSTQEGQFKEINIEPDIDVFLQAALVATDENNILKALELYRVADRLEERTTSTLRLGFIQGFQGGAMSFQRLSKADQMEIVKSLEEIERDSKTSRSFAQLTRYALANTLFEMGNHEAAKMYLKKVIQVSPSIHSPQILPFEQYDSNSPPIIMAVATKENEQLQNLRESAKTSQVQMVVLGLGTKYQPWSKPSLYLEYLESLPPGQLVVGLDAYDVLVSPNILTKAHQMYRKFGCQVVVGADTFSYPDSSVALLYPSLPASGPRFLNSGNFVGTAYYLVQLMRETVRYDSHEDQRAFTRYYLEHPDRICIDYKAELFITLFGLDYEIHMLPPLAEFWVPSSNATPISLHGNAQAGKVLYEKAVKARTRVLETQTMEVLSPDPFMCGIKQFSENDYSKAAVSFLRVLEQDPSNFNSRMNLGISLQNMGHWEAARAVFLETLQKYHPTSAESHFHAGNCAIVLGKPTEAVELYQSGLKLDPTHTKLSDSLRKALLS